MLTYLKSLCTAAKGRLRHLLLGISLMAVVACSLPAIQSGTAQTAAGLQQVQATSTALDTQLTQLKAQLAALPSPATVSTLQQQVSDLQKQLSAATTQPDSSVQVSALTTQIATLKLQIAAAPSSDSISKLQAQITSLQAQKVLADQLLATLTTAATQAAAGTANATTPAQAAGSILTAAATPAAAIPTYGWAISLGLSLIGNFLLAGKSQQNAQAATSIAQSVAVAAQAGQITVSPAAVATLDAIQTPAAKAIIDAHQAATGTASLGDLVTTTPTK